MWRGEGDVPQLSEQEMVSGKDYVYLSVDFQIFAAHFLINSGLDIDSKLFSIFIY